jgi:hypothetical protein
MPPDTLVVSPGVSQRKMVHPGTPFIDSIQALCSAISRARSGVPFFGILIIISSILFSLFCRHQIAAAHSV